MFVNIEFKLQKLEFTVNTFVKSVKKYNELGLKLLKSSNSKLNNNKSSYMKTNPKKIPAGIIW
jgi:hypothetical protein